MEPFNSVLIAVGRLETNTSDGGSEIRGLAKVICLLLNFCGDLYIGGPETPAQHASWCKINKQDPNLNNHRVVSWSDLFR
jgi:hypothetical protein